MNSKSGIKAPSKPTLPKPTHSSTGRSDSISLSRSSSVSTLASVAEGKEGPDGQEVELFNVGEKIWVNGTKPGIVQYMGETQFAPGVWAGITLQEPGGKNDGSVNGVRYFQCKPQQGIFIRPHRLTREAGSPPGLSGDSSIKAREPTPPPASLISRVSSTPGSLVTSPSRHACSKMMKTGDRVLVSSAHGNKSGILRFLGTTDFAVGEWAGIELDLPTGKNDGSVSGNRYFTCKMKHGLFAPISKVAPYSTMFTSPGSVTGGFLKNRSCSRESLNSTTSSVSYSKIGRVKLGVNSLGSGQKSPGSGSTISQTALQEALKEKEEHIGQLLKERDLDREELARGANQAETVKQQLSVLQEQHKSFVQENETQVLFLKELCDKTDMERKQLSSLLGEEKRFSVDYLLEIFQNGNLAIQMRKMEDLQFRLEEETILKSDLESQAEKERQKIKELEDQVKETNKSQIPQDQLKKTEMSLQEKDGEITSMKSEVERMTSTVRSKDEQIAELMTSIADLKGKSLYLESDSIKKTELESKLKDLEGQFQTLSSVKNNLTNEMSDLKKVICDQESKEKENQIEVDSLRNTLEKKTEEAMKFSTELEQNKLFADSKDRLEKELLELKSTKDAVTKNSNEKVQQLILKIESLTADLNQKDSLISGDVSKIQLLNQSLGEKESEIERLQYSLMESKQTSEAAFTENASQLKILQEKVAQRTEDNNRLQTSQTQKEQQLTAETEKLSQEHKRLESEILNLKISLENMDKDAAKSKSELEASRKEVSLLNQSGSEQMSSFQDKISELQKIIKKFEADAEKKEQDFIKEKEGLSQKQKKHESEIQNVKIVLESKDKDLGKFKSELEASRIEVIGLNREKSEQISGLQNKISDLMKEIETTKTNTEKKEQQSATERKIASQEQEKLESKIHNLVITLNSKDKDLEKARSELEDSKKEVTLLSQGSTQQIFGLQTKISELKGVIDSANSETEQQKQKFTTQIEALSQERKALESNMNNLKASFETKDKDLAQLKSELEESKKTVLHLNQGSSEQISGLQNEVSKMKKEIENQKNEAEQATKHSENERQLLVSRLDEKADLLLQQEQMSEKLNETLHHKEKAIYDLEESVKRYMTQLKENSNQFEEKEKLLTSKLQQIELSMGTAVGERQESVKSYENEISELKSLIEEKERDTLQKQKAVQNLKSAVQEKESQITELGQLVELSQKQLEQLKLQNNNNVTLLESRIAEFKVEQEKHFVEKEKILGSEIERLQAELEKKTSDLEQSILEVNCCKSNEKVLQEEFKKQKQLIAQNQSDKAVKLSQETTQCEDLKKQLQLAKVHCDKLKSENDEAIKQAKLAQKACQESEQSKNSLIEDRLKHLALIEDRDKKLELLQNEVERMRREFTQHKNELQQQLDVSQMELQAMKDFKAQLELQHEVLEELQQQLQESESKSAKLNNQLQSQLNIGDEKKQLDQKVKDLQGVLNNAMTKLTGEEEVNQILRKQLDGNEALLILKNDELEKLKLAAPKTDSNEVANLKSQLAKLNEEKMALSQELIKAKTIASSGGDSKDNNSASDAEWVEEKESLLSQVNFLNSIIVDMQKKNEELKKKLESNDVEKDLNLNGFKAPRFFCDICDVFDLHDTEDCPKQCSLEEDDEVVVSHSKHNGKRSEERPYCNNCEIFGHWTLDCDQEETF